MVLQVIAGLWMAFVAITIVYLLAASIIGTREFEGGLLAGCAFYFAMAALAFWGARHLGRPSPIATDPGGNGGPGEGDAPRARPKR